MAYRFGPDPLDDLNAGYIDDDAEGDSDGGLDGSGAWPHHQTQRTLESDDDAETEGDASDGVQGEGEAVDTTGWDSTGSATFVSSLEHELHGRMQALRQSMEAQRVWTAGADSDSDEDVAAQSMTNDDLLFDPAIDEDNERWMQRQRQRHWDSEDPLQDSARLAADAANRRYGLEPKPTSDAILNCPACMVTLCIDCQQHDLYSDQFRAMFVINCRIDASEQLRFADGESKKKRRSKTKTVCLRSFPRFYASTDRKGHIPSVDDNKLSN